MAVVTNRNRSGWRVVGSLSLLVMVALPLSGCSLFYTPLPETGELEGTWVNKEDGGSITFDGDGTLLLVGIPGNVIGVTELETPVEAEGTWTLDGDKFDSRNYRGHARIELALDLPDQPWTIPVDLVGGRSNRTLYFIVGDPDAFDNYWMEKQ